VRIALHLLSVILVVAPGAFATQPSTNSAVARLRESVEDRTRSSSERQRSLSELAASDGLSAVQASLAVLNDADSLLRFQAAWLLARSGDDRGANLLRRELAAETTETFTLVVRALGRLRDPASHDALVASLERRVPMERLPLGEVSALVCGIADYRRPGDANALVEALRRVRASGSATSWVLVDALGKTGGANARPLLAERFASSERGWAKIAAGLALSRCGDEEGRKYVAARLDTLGSEPLIFEKSQTSNVWKDDPFGPAATEFLVRHLGLEQDLCFISFLEKTIRNRSALRARALAWGAIVRLDPTELDLDLAWNDLIYQDAQRFLALRHAAFSPPSRIAEDPRARSLVEEARFFQTTVDRDRAKWRAIETYPFD